MRPENMSSDDALTGHVPEPGLDPRALLEAIRRLETAVRAQAGELRALSARDRSETLGPILERLERLERSKLDSAHAAAERGMLQAELQQARERAEQLEREKRLRAAEREAVEAENMRLKEQLEQATRPRPVFRRTRGG